MKLLKTHLVPGGVVKTYLEHNNSKVAKFTVDLMAESPTESAALARLASDLLAMADAIQKKSAEINDEAIKQSFLNRIRTTGEGKTREERRKQFLESVTTPRRGTEPEQENPYGTE